MSEITSKTVFNYDGQDYDTEADALRAKATARIRAIVSEMTVDSHSRNIILFATKHEKWTDLVAAVEALRTR
jgi:hypothetical protein